MLGSLCPATFAINVMAAPWSISLLTAQCRSEWDRHARSGSPAFLKVACKSRRGRGCSAPSVLRSSSGRWRHDSANPTI